MHPFQLRKITKSPRHLNAFHDFLQPNFRPIKIDLTVRIWKILSSRRDISFTRMRHEGVKK